MKTLWFSMYKLCATLCLVFLYATTYAQTQHALLIGISQYKEVTPLQFADRDAVAFAEFLKTQQVPEDNIKLFLNENATRFNIVDELYNTSQQLKKGDRFYFYFGGHGDLEARIGYENSLLLLYNSFKKSYFQGNEYLQLSELKTWFNDLTKKGVEVVFIADACHSGGLIGGKEGNTKTQKALQESWANITKILSCKADEFSLEGKQWGGGRGIFSYHLVNGLTGRADANKDNKVSLSELNNYLTTNVLREANPNIQTPVILGNNTQFLSKVSKEGLAKLADYEKRNFPIITEVNIKGGEEHDALLISKLDTMLVYTYKQFTKALKARRLNTFDDSTDYALLHYKKLIARKIPDNLVQLMKQNLGAGLMERELLIMKNVREKGAGVPHNAQIITPAIRNLEEATKLFGSNHYIAPFLQSRILVLESCMPQQMPSIKESIDQSLQSFKDYQKKRKSILLKALNLEPNMISTYALLGFSYRNNQQPDSSRYYQEKVVELMPNESSAHVSLGDSYIGIPYKDANGKTAPHPKGIEHLERAIELQPAHLGYQRTLGNIYFGLTIPDYYDYKKAIPIYEKHLTFVEKAHINLMKQPLSYRQEGAFYYEETFHNEATTRYNGLAADYALLHLFYKDIGDTAKAASNFRRFIQTTDTVGTVYSYMTAALLMYQVALNGQDLSYFKNALDFQQKALKKCEADLKIVPVSEKLDAQIVYRELIKGLGVTHRILQNYTEAENYFQQSFAYAVDAPTGGHFKYIGSMGGRLDSTRVLFVTVPNGIHKHRNGDYHYRINAYQEMFHSKFEQGKTEEAFVWLEKAFENSATEFGNDVSGQPWENGFFEAYKTIDQARFKALKAKYFPPTEKK